ncbi:MAG: ORF6N domain-containing protein [Nitrospirae bacterium]|nr:ORF6N domain-containing protein [Nitrospirota bacterium]
MSGLVPIERIEKSILFLRGQKVMLDADLARIYGVATKVLNQAVKRNRERFPDDFMFQLTREEAKQLQRSRSQIATPNRSQFVTGSQKHRDPRFLPYAFTEHGAIMAANVLNSPIAVRASLQVVRAFVRLREMLATHKDLARKLEALERKYDSHFKVVFDAIRHLMAHPEPKEKKIGFRARERESRYKTSGRKRASIHDGASVTGRI